MTERELGQLSWSRPITVVLEEEDGYDERIRSQIYNWMLFSAPEPEGEDKTTITLRKATIKANFPSIHLTVFNRALAALIEEGKATCDNPDARNAEYVFRRSVANLTEVEEDDPPSSSSGEHRIKEGEDSGFDDIGHIAEQENIGKKNVRADKCIKSLKASHKKMKPAKEVDPPPSSPQSAPSSSSSSKLINMDRMSHALIVLSNEPVNKIGIDPDCMGRWPNATAPTISVWPLPQPILLVDARRVPSSES